jgi:hypothetical protein
MGLRLWPAVHPDQSALWPWGLRPSGHTNSLQFHSAQGFGRSLRSAGPRSRPARHIDSTTTDTSRATLLTHPGRLSALGLKTTRIVSKGLPQLNDGACHMPSDCCIAIAKQPQHCNVSIALSMSIEGLRQFVKRGLTLLGTPVCPLTQAIVLTLSCAASFQCVRTYALNTVSDDCTIPPAVATPLIKGGRGDPNAIGSASNGDCVSPVCHWQDFAGSV